MDNKIKRDIDFINYIKPIFGNERMEKFLIKSEKIHKKICKEKGIKINRFSLTHIESVTCDTIIFEGVDFYGEALFAIIPLEKYK